MDTDNLPKAPPRFVVFDLGCSSVLAASNIQNLVRQICVIDTHILIRSVSHEGAKKTLFEIADYFKEVKILSGVNSDPCKTRIVFLLQPNADRFWRDIVFRVLGLTKKAVANVVVNQVYVGNDCLDWELL
jgi:hypothetical protein